eukprot:224683_1
MQWEELAAFPEDITFSNLAMISRSTFVAIPNHAKGDGSPKADGIYAYYSNTNKWSMYWHYPTWMTLVTDAITVDLETKQLYLLNKACKSSIGIMNLTSKSLKIHEQKKEEALPVGSGSTTLIIDSELHVIGGKVNPRHLVYKNKKFSVIRRWKKMRGFCDHGSVYIKSRDMILLFGGTRWKTNNKADTDNTDAMWSYSVTKGTWTKLPQTLPSKCSKFGYIFTVHKHKDYICIFDTTSGNVYVLDVDTMQFNISSVKCPTRAPCYAALTRGKSNAKKVHLVKRSGGEHWRIGLGALFRYQGDSVANTPGTKVICNEEDMKSNNLNNDPHRYAHHVKNGEQPSGQVLHVATLLKEIQALKARNDILTKSQESLKTMNNNLLDEKREFESKYLRIQKALCYNMWTVDDVYEWMIHIDNARYNKYSNELLKNLKEEGIIGNCLEVINETDLHRIGIKDFRDKKWLKQQIENLIKNNKRKDDELAVCTICYNDTMSFAVEPCHHLYCKQCATSFALCPKCRTKITGSFQVYQ